MVRWAWGSRSIKQTVLPSSARAAPRLTVVVVFPTPPFWFIRAMIRMGSRLLAGPRWWARVRALEGNYRARARDYKVSEASGFKAGVIPVTDRIATWRAA